MRVDPIFFAGVEVLELGDVEAAPILINEDPEGRRGFRLLLEQQQDRKDYPE